MHLENTDNEWMKEAPTLAAMERKTAFTVPDDYFIGLKATTLSRCTVEDARFNNEDEFAVPAGYFESLSAQIEAGIAEQNIRSLSPAEGFKVPENYFNELGARILAKTQGVNKPFESQIKPIRSNWMRYAAAATVTLVLGSVLIFNSQKSNFDSQLGNIPDQEIINYLQLHTDISDTPLILESLSQNVNLTNIGNEITDAEIEDYINTTL